MTTVLLAAIINASFALPMRFMPRWKFENTWLLYSVLALLILPAALAAATVPDLPAIIVKNYSTALLLIAIGLCWGMGQVCFGQALEKLGISLATVIMLGISVVLGSVAPLWWMKDSYRLAALITLIATLSLAGLLCSWLGRRESRRDQGRDQGLWYAVAAGVGAGLFNIAVVAGLPITVAAVRLGGRAEFAQIAAWLPFLLAGGVVNVGYCVYKLIVNKSATLFLARGNRNYWALAAVMAGCWLGSSLLYGFGTEQMGVAGPSVAFPVYISFIVVNTTILGALVGEWRGLSRRSIFLLQAGQVLLIASIVLAARAQKLAL